MISRFYLDVKTPAELQLSQKLETLGLGNSEINEYVICKTCGFGIPSSEIDPNEKVWYCKSCNSANSYKSSKRQSEKRFIWDFKKVNDSVKNKLEELPEVCDRQSHWIAGIEGKKVPVTIVDSPYTSSLHLLLNQYNAGVLLVYLFEDNKKKLSNIFTADNFVFIKDFLEQDRNQLKKRLTNINLSYNFAKIIQAEEEIESIANFAVLETKVTERLNLLKKNEDKLKELLALLQKNKDNVLGTRFVRIGGNYPSDILPIQLHSYMNRFLEVNRATGYEVKNIEAKLTWEKFSKKMETNPGRSMIFITSAKEVSGRIWKYIIDAERTSNSWPHIIIDFDMLSLLWAYTSIETNE